MSPTRSKKNRKTLANFMSSGPESSMVTPPKQNCPSNAQQIKELQQEVSLLKEAKESHEKEIVNLKSKIQNIETRCQLGVGTSEDPITLYSENLTPELKKIGNSLHLWDVPKIIVVDFDRWSIPHSQVGQIGRVIPLELIENIRQLPPVFKNGHLRYPMNIEFKNSMCRIVGMQHYKEYCQARGISMAAHHSLATFPTLRHNVRAISNILSGLKKDGIITFYSLNNFMAIEHGERVAPMWSFKVRGMESPSEFKNCPTNSMYHSEFCVPTSDVNFQSPEFHKLRNAMLEYIMAVKESLPTENEAEKSSTPGTEMKGGKSQCAEMLNVDLSKAPPQIGNPTPSPPLGQPSHFSQPKVKNTKTQSPRGVPFQHPPPPPPAPPTHTPPKIGHHQLSPPIPISQIYGTAMNILHGRQSISPTVRNYVSPNYMTHPTAYNVANSPIFGPPAHYNIPGTNNSPPLPQVNQNRFTNNMNHAASFQQFYYQ